MAPQLSMTWQRGQTWDEKKQPRALRVGDFGTYHRANFAAVELGTRSTNVFVVSNLAISGVHFRAGVGEWRHPRGPTVLIVY